MVSEAEILLIRFHSKCKACQYIYRIVYDYGTPVSYGTAQDIIGYCLHIPCPY